MSPSAPRPDHHDRGEHMVRRVGRALRDAGVDEDRSSHLDELHRLVMATRRRGIPDDHHHAFLHPGRTALVLLADAEVREPELLAAALLVDTERPELVPSEEGLGEWVAAADLAADVPRPTDDDLAERLVTGSEGLRLVALAERLDQLRHAHLWDDPDAERAALGSAREVYLPVARRTHPVLARRYAWWCRTFARRGG